MKKTTIVTLFLLLFATTFCCCDKAFGFLWFKSKKIEEVPKGYYGQLPNVNADFNYKKHVDNMTGNDIDAKIPTKDELEDANLKHAPYDDTLFLDNIVKKKESSNYVNDVQKTKFALKKLKNCLEENGDIQRYNAAVNVADLYVQSLRKKYEHQADCYRVSYIEILNTNNDAKILGNLMYDSNYYSRYVPTQNGKYSKSNIEAQKRLLLNKINKTLFEIDNEQ